MVWFVFKPAMRVVAGRSCGLLLWAGLLGWCWGRSRRVPGGVALFRWNNFGVALERRGVDSNGLSALVKPSTGDLATCKLLVRCWCPQRTWNSTQRNYFRRLPWTLRLVDWICSLRWSLVGQKQASSINTNVKTNTFWRFLSCWIRESPSVHFCGASALF